MDTRFTLCRQSLIRRGRMGCSITLLITREEPRIVEQSDRLVGDSGIAVWNELRLFLATQPFQILVRAEYHKREWIYRANAIDRSRGGSQCNEDCHFVRIRSFAQNLGRFVPRN